MVCNGHLLTGLRPASLSAAAHGRWETHPLGSSDLGRNTLPHLLPDKPSPLGSAPLASVWAEDLLSPRLPKISTFVSAFLNTAALDAGTSHPCSWSHRSLRYHRGLDSPLRLWKYGAPGSPPSLLLWLCSLVLCGSWERPVILCSDEAECLQPSSGSASFTPQLRGPLSPPHLAHFCLSFPWLKGPSLPCISISEVRNGFSSQPSAPAFSGIHASPSSGSRGSNTRLFLTLPHTPQKEPLLSPEASTTSIQKKLKCI